MKEELRQLMDDAAFEAREIGVSVELREEIKEFWRREEEERSMRVNRLHRGTKE